MLAWNVALGSQIRIPSKSVLKFSVVRFGRSANKLSCTAVRVLNCTKQPCCKAREVVMLFSVDQGQEG